jgi:hypothetical protein
MRCAICGIQIDSVDEAIEEGWCPYFYDNETEHEVACAAVPTLCSKRVKMASWKSKRSTEGN